jgi:hypothetical protein
MVRGWRMRLELVTVFILMVSTLAVSQLVIATQFLFTVNGKHLQKLLIPIRQYV